MKFSDYLVLNYLENYSEVLLKKIYFEMIFLKWPIMCFHNPMHYLPSIFLSFFTASTDHLFGYFIISVTFLAFFI